MHTYYEQDGSDAKLFLGKELKKGWKKNIAVSRMPDLDNNSHNSLSWTR